MTKFQLILTGVFGFFILAAVATFALYKGGSSSLEATIYVWGELPSEEIVQILDDAVPSLDKNLTIRYREIASDKIDEEYTEALSTGEAPDILLITQDRLWKNRAKLLVIPYASVGARDFQEAFIEEGELFLGPEGIYAFPIGVDPMVLYYNRDLLTAAGQAKPLSFWDEIYQLTPKHTKRDAAGNITQSIIAMGETKNIPHYKEILSLLMLQAGSPITTRATQGLVPVLNNTFDLPVAPAESALDFYTQFANPAKAFYSWNKALPEAQTHFTSGDSAYYLGFASELPLLRNKNPNLNLGISTVPQSRVSNKSITYGKLYGAAISRGTRNPAAASRAALLLASRGVSERLIKSSNLSPARRDILSDKPVDSVNPVLYQAALQSRGWLDPENNASRIIFQNMIDGVTSGRARTSEALSNANSRLEALMK